MPTNASGIRTVLVVDDLAIFREPIELVLRGQGYTVITAADGQEALAHLSAGRPDVVLLDLGMPVLDGIAVLKHMRGTASHKATPVIVLSAEADRDRVKEAVALGISGYMLKAQFSVKGMLARVNQICGHTADLPGGRSGAGAPTAASAGRAVVPTAADACIDPAAAPALRLASSDTGASSPTRPSAESHPNDAVTDVKDLKPEITRAELNDKLRASEELKGFSPTVTRVLKLTASQTCSLEAVAKAVTQDQAMALKILKIANSSAYTRGDRVDTVQKAVLRIGMESIRQAVLNVGVVEHFSSEAFEKHMRTAPFWEHAIACGIIAADIAHALGGKDTDSAFTSGLLHDLGRVILAQELGHGYVRVLETAARLAMPLEQVETRMLLMNHADVMDRLLTAWHFPRHLVDPIMFHHLSPGNARSVSPTKAREILRLGLADRLAHALLLGSSGNDTIYPTEEHCRFVGVTADMVRSIIENARQQTADTKVALVAQSSGGVWARQTDQVRGQITSAFAPLFVSMEPGLDAFGIFCSELAGADAGGSPNIAVVHIANPKEREPLVQKLAAAEQERGATNLPLITLSPAGQFALPDRVVQGRTVQSLSTPMPIARFVRAVNALTAATQRAAA